jgi:D-alanyl-D-alanine carboxypeptidase/D-alanyl-D-alanine-endopeptidase (penicillin-binding protein 4)
MIPASNMKLLTSALALQALGKDFKFRTQLLVRGETASGDVELAVIGDGDPTFGDAELLKDIAGWDTRTVFASWAKQLKLQGVRRVSAIRLDDSVFDDQRVHPSWPLEQRHFWYEAQIGALTLNINCLDFHVFRRGDAALMGYRLDPPTRYATVENTLKRGTKNAVALTRREGGNVISLGGQTNAREQGPILVTIDNPTAYFGTVFAETLREAGIDCGETVTDRAIRSEWEARAPVDAASVPDPAGWRLLAVHETSLPTVLARTNKDSINLYAENLAKRVAFAATGQPGSWPAAQQAARDFLAQIGSEPEAIHLDDGSGMSRGNRLTAEVLCDVLAAMHHSDAAEMYRDSLSEAGVDGTLQRRFRAKGRQELHSRVFGKTGYISGVCTFSGYLHGRDGRWYAFSILVNDSSDLARAQQLQEEIVAALDRSLAPAPATAEAR